ncbi:MAG: 30S ribosomal protein S12 methylthiotransferase RimO [Acidobacteria bacterium]|nr:30S ribosomal protein S12 methylthiotransferase RimO [Acidobacteriota bacterium]
MSKSSQPTAPTVGFVSLGCPKNLVDSEVMMGLLDRGGARLTSRPEEAEILVVNTCSFIDTAKQESVDTILEMARFKTEGQAKKLIVAGCLVERYRDEIRKSIPEVDAVVGTGELESILEAAGIARPTAAAPSPFNILSGNTEIRSGQESLSGTHKASLKGTGFSPYDKPSANQQGALAPEVSFRPEGDLREQQGRFSREDWDGATHALPTYLYTEDTPRLISTGRTSAYIKIAEGCDHPCTFCVIPNLRGKFRSRRFESVVAEAQRLVSSGVQEITLIGQDTTCYGEDLGLKDGLAALLDAIACIEGLRWLRFLYAYPNRITGKLLETIAKHDNICKYLDVPLQHASPDVLKRMKRGAGADIFLKTVEKVRAAVPGIALRTSFIVGFPGESQTDFETLEQFISAARFDWLGVFNYSDEEGSKAFALDSKLNKRTIEARKRRLMKLQQKISRQAKQQWVGRELVILAEGESSETELLWEGRTEFHAPEIDGKVYINDFGDLSNLEAGKFYRAEITEAHDYDLVARVTSGPL